MTKREFEFEKIVRIERSYMTENWGVQTAIHNNYNWTEVFRGSLKDAKFIRDSFLKVGFKKDK